METFLDMATKNPTPWMIITEHAASRAAVKKFVSGEVARDPSGKPAEDQRNIESAKKLILDLVDNLPEEFNGATVRADGRVLPNETIVYVSVRGAKILTE